MVGLATVATSNDQIGEKERCQTMRCLVIASQAIITGCFSLLSQAGSLGFCPPLRVEHTSEKIYGQIYVPVEPCVCVFSLRMI